MALLYDTRWQGSRMPISNESDQDLNELAARLTGAKPPDLTRANRLIDLYRRAQKNILEQ